MFTGNFKINTALLISLAFIFRVAMVNIYSFASQESPYSKALQDSYFSGSFKKRMAPTEVSTKPDFEKCTITEICEESSDSEEELQKSSSPAVFSILFSILTPTVSIAQSNHSFDFIKYCLHPKKYLSLSVLRV